MTEEKAICAVKHIIQSMRESKERKEEREKSAEDYCKECNHIEICGWHPYDGCEFRETAREKGVFVNGWSLPDGCITCPFFTGQGCKVTMALFPDYLNVSTRPKGCPLEGKSDTEDKE